MNELKPCPFCGNAPQMHKDSWPPDDKGNNAKRFWIRCGKCGSCSDEYLTRGAAEHAWKRRTDDER